MSALEQPQIPPTWEDVREALREALNTREATAFSRWFEPVTGGVEEGADGIFTLRLVVPSGFHADWITKNYEAIILAIWRQFAPQGRVVIDAKPKEATKPKTLPSQRKTAEIIQLPLWPEKARAAPNVILRSALFPATNKRRWLDNKLIASLDGVEIRFQGKSLTQKHFDTWAEVVHLARNHPLGGECSFTAYGLLKAQKLGTGSSDYKQLDDELTDLLQPVIITWNKKTYKGGLIYRVKKDEDTKRYKVLLDPDIIKLFSPDEYTLMDWEQRRQLGRSPLAKAVHNHIISHASMFAYTLEKWRELTGSTEDLKQYRRRFKKVLHLLKKKGIIQDGYIDPKTDLVHIKRGAGISASQQRYLAPAPMKLRKKRSV